MMDVVFWIASLAVLSMSKAEVFTEPSLAAILNDPAADGYDRTFSRCQVEAEDFQATVTSTAYRVLKGVCNPTELEDHLAAMEDRLNKKLEQMTQTLLSHLKTASGSNGGSQVPAGDNNNHSFLDGDTKHEVGQSELKKQKAASAASYRQSGAIATLPQNDFGAENAIYDTEQRRLAVQRLLPKPAAATTAVTAAPQPAAGSGPRRRNHPSSPNDNILRPAPLRVTANTRKAPETAGTRSWNTIKQDQGVPYQAGGRGIRRNSDFNRSYKAVGRPWKSTPAQLSKKAGRWQTEQPQQRATGGGKHVTDTISSVSDRRSAAQSRYPELRSHNDTVYHRNGRKMYSYYWKIEEMPEKMASFQSAQHLQSPRFYVFHGGYRMSMRLFPNRNGRSLLVRAGLAPGRNDARLRWPFSLPFRLTLLDHSRRPADIQSRTWRPAEEPCPARSWQRPPGHHRRLRYQHRRAQEGSSHYCLGLSVTHQLLMARRTLLDGALLIKMDVFLDDEAEAKLG